jgi:hypothetical protein
MDTFSTLNITHSVAQFVEFGCSIISNTTQIYKSIHGATVSQIETTFAARRLLELSERMQSSLREQTLPKKPFPPPSKPHPPEPPTLDDSTPASQVESDKWATYERLKDEYDIELATYPVRKADFERRMGTYARAEKSHETLSEICRKCIALSNDLLAKLKELRLQGPKHRKFKSLLLALRSVWSSEAIGDFQKRIEAHRRELSDHLLAAMW